jgi:dienelactone hydrolase
VFHGEYFTIEMMKSGQLMSWVGEHGSWDKSVKTDVTKTFEWAKKTWGVEKAGIIGFCYGGKMVVQALADLPFVEAGATCHPSFLQMEDADPIKAPICLLPSKDEDEKISVCPTTC